jgi:uncharacterized protein
MILPITLTVAGAAALLHIWLSFRVGQLRRHFSILVGDGGNEALSRRMRAHANFGENTPIFLILLALLELAGANQIFLWVAGILFVLSRILHAFGMDRPGANPLRAIGISLSWLMLLAAAGYGLTLTYLDRGPERVQTAPFRLG